MNWIKTTERTPPMIEGKDYSKNVFAVCDGKLCIMAYRYVQSEDDGGWYYAWANCYGNISGDAEYDDEYNVTLWQDLPELPKEKSTCQQ